MNAIVRRLTSDDVERAHAINEDNVPAVGSLEQARWDALLGQCAIALVVEPPGADEIAGFCLLVAPGAAYGSVNYRWFMERYPDAMYLDRVAIDERFRGQGLGALLYAEVDRIITAEHPSATHLTLEVNVDPPNPRSMAFHARLGFNEVGRQRTDYGAVVALMARPVTSASSRFA